MERPTFAFRGNPVRAAGLIVYTLDNDKEWMLLRECKNKWSDIGGKTEPGDKTIIDTIVREVCEETNNHLFSENDTAKMCQEKLFQLLQGDMYAKYDKKCKYLILKCLVPIGLKQEDNKRFGQSEKQPHKYEWHISYPKKVHFRLRGCLFNPRWDNVSLIDHQFL